MSLPSIDWTALAADALELVGKPAMVLDDARVVRVWNGAMQALLGRARQDAVGKAWLEARGVPELDGSRDTLEQAIARDRSEATTIALGADGRKLTLKVALTKGASGKGTIVVVSDHQAANAASELPEGDLWYEVSAKAADRWALRKVDGDRARASGDAIGAPCFVALQRRSSPCPGCPALAIHPGETRTGVIPSGAGEPPIRLVVARAGDGVVSMRSWDVSDATLWALVEAKVRLLAVRADLSPREQDVLLWLLRGRTPQDVATILGIAPRTVKFHQANVLRKLGAESRADLLRLLF